VRFARFSASLKVLLPCAKNWQLLDSIEVLLQFDRTLIGTMVCSFAWVAVAITMKAGDYFRHRKR